MVKERLICLSICLEDEVLVTLSLRNRHLISILDVHWVVVRLRKINGMSEIIVLEG